MYRFELLEPIAYLGKFIDLVEIFIRSMIMGLGFASGGYLVVRRIIRTNFKEK